jgi:radical SAM-linked protein
MTQEERFRYRIGFAKTAEMRFTSHLDVHRAWERTLRRSGIRVAYTQGFNPRPKMTLSSALPLGFTSECELIDVWLEEQRTSQEIFEGLMRAAPPGLSVQHVEKLEPGEPSLSSQIHAVEYVVRLDSPPPHPQLSADIQDLINSTTALRQRRGKEYDLRALLHSIILDPPHNSEALLRMTLSSREGATGRPEEVLLALGLDPTHALIHRTRLVFTPQ